MWGTVHECRIYLTQKYHTNYVLTIEPDIKFLTQNTIDLTAPLKVLDYVEFNKDLDDILNKKGQKLKCQQQEAQLC